MLHCVPFSESPSSAMRFFCCCKPTVSLFVPGAGFLDSFWRDVEWGRMHPSLRTEGTPAPPAPAPAPFTGTNTGTGTGTGTGTNTGTGTGTGTGLHSDSLKQRGPWAASGSFRAVDAAARGSCIGSFPEARASSAGFTASAEPWGAPGAGTGTFQEASRQGGVEELGTDSKGWNVKGGEGFVSARRTVSLQEEVRGPGEGCLRGFTCRESRVQFQAVEREGGGRRYSGGGRNESTGGQGIEGEGALGVQE